MITWIILAVLTLVIVIMIGMAFKLNRVDDDVQTLLSWAKDLNHPHIRFELSPRGRLIVRGVPSNEH